MRFVSSIATLLATLSLASAARATPVTYTFKNTVLQTASGGTATVTGTIDFNFDPTNSLGDYVAATNFTVNAGGMPYNFVSSATVGYSQPAPRDNAALFQLMQIVSPTSSYQFNLVLELFNNFPVPFNPDGATLCPVGGGCTSHQFAASSAFFVAGSGVTYNDISGTLQDAAPTPELSSLLLLGSGMATLAGMARQRRRR